MKQRLELAQAIMEGPSLLLLDEPSNALDSHGLELLCGIIREEHERGATVLLAAHNTPELTELGAVGPGGLPARARRRRHSRRARGRVGAADGGGARGPAHRPLFLLCMINEPCCHRMPT